MDGGTPTQSAFDNMKAAFNNLDAVEKSRELALAMTNLEQAMMWLNKHRANVGELTASETHVVA